MDYTSTLTAVRSPSWRGKRGRISIAPATLVSLVALMLLVVMMASVTYVGRADNFTDIFYTNSFRGAFNWIKKLDWVGMFVQIVISCFSLFGVALMTVRIMTSMLFLSSKGLWEEVHDLKQSGGESEFFDFGLVGMAKSWAKGKAGTGLDAIIGAVLLILPDVKKYSDFGEKASGDFDENMSISQYMLKIALPTIMTVFFFAMGFNGTLFQFLAVTVDAMGTAADKAISVNYSGLVEDLVNSGTGYNFAFSASGSNLGKFQQGVSKDIYGRLVSEVRGADAEQLSIIGANVEKFVGDYFDYESLSESSQLSESVQTGLADDSTSTGGVVAADSFIPYIGYEIVVNTSSNAEGEYASLTLSDAFKGVPRLADAYNGNTQKVIHIFIKQTTSFSGTYFNLDGAAGN